MYWSLQSLPELQHLSNHERKELVRSSTGRFFAVRLIMHCLALALVCSFVITFVMQAVIKNLFGDPATQALFVIFPALLLGLWISIYQLMLIRTRGQLRLYLEERKEAGFKPPVCLQCGYAIHNEAQMCTECGAEI